MYNVTTASTYASKNKPSSSFYVLNSKGVSSTNYYYGNVVEYDGSNYVLKNSDGSEATQKLWSSNYSMLTGYYTCRSETATTCSEVYYVAAGTSSTQYEDIPYELLGDKIHIKGVVNNLLTNAIKYTEKGQINLNVKCINQDQTCLLIISVQDTGQGIKAENINKLFTKFERLDIERNITTEGTGLGLAITKALVEMMGGKINV